MLLIMERLEEGVKFKLIALVKVSTVRWFEGFEVIPGGSPVVDHLTLLLLLLWGLQPSQNVIDLPILQQSNYSMKLQ